jgi:hypothetical protein
MPMREPFRTQSFAFVLIALGALLPGARAGATPPAAPAGPPPNRPPPHPGAGPAGAGEDDGRSFPERPVPPGEWSENKRYKFRLERIEACGAGPVRALRGEISWVGAYFSVEAKEPELFVAARDLELRRGGVILGATVVQPPELAGCKPLLVPKRLRTGEKVSGFALFEVPKSFRVTTQDPIVVSYQPTRWGGARRATVPVPECLDACAKSWVNKDVKAGARAAPASGRKL